MPPEPPRFRRELVAQPADIDELGHVSNITYVRWLQLVATEHSAAGGWDQAAYRTLGAVFVVRRHEIDYRAPAYQGDRIQLCTWVEWWRTASTLRRTEITRLSDGALLASAATLWALVSFESGRPRRIPDELRRPFSPPE
ncbi:MAG TPA: thioesterase family protein [Kofleriaceae bacterium]|nr:thioesterase family protein [Kofleriaceae bacterium]